MKTGNVKVPGALIATDKKGVVAYAGDINDEITRILDEEESIVEASQHEINLELISWKDTMTKRDPENPDLDNYYTISEVDNLLNGKIGLSNIIQQAYSTVDGQVVSNVDFSRNTVADYTTIPSMDVFKKFVPQIHDAHDIEYAISSYGRGVFESKIGLSSNKIPTIGSVIDLINASNNSYIPPLINDSGDYTHLTLTQAVFSASYIDNAVFGAGGYGEFPKSSMKSYVDSLKTVFAKIVYDFEADDLSELEINGESTERTEWISKIYDCVSSSTPIVIFIVDELDSSKICPCIIENVNSNECVLHFEKDNNIYTATIDQDSVDFTSSKYGVHLYEDKIRGAYLHLDYDLTFANDDRDDLYDLKDLFEMILNGAMIPLYTDSKTYNLVSCINVPQPMPIVPPGATPPPSFTVFVLYYIDLFGTEATTNPAYIVRLSRNRQTHEVTSEIEVTTTAELIQGVVTDSALFQAPISIPVGNSSIESSILGQLSWMHTNLIGKILIGGNNVTTFYDSSVGALTADLTEELKHSFIFDNPDTMLAKLQNLNTSAADAYKYDFSGEGNYNVSTDFDAYKDLKNNLVLEVNGLRKKLANINVGTTYATQTALDTLAGKVYAGLYGNNTGTNTLGDTTKLQSLKAVVEWLGLKSSIGNSLGAYITNISEGIYQTITGSDESVLYLSKTQGNSGLQFVSNLDSLGHILGSASLYERDREFSYTDVGSSDMAEIIGHEADGFIMTAGGIEKLVADITGFNYSYIDFSNYDTIKDRLESLEGFKETFDAEGFSPEDVLNDISDLNTSVSGISGDLTTLEGTVSTLNGAAITGIKIKATDGESSTYAEIDVTKPAVSGVADLTSLATKGYVDNAILSIESLGNLTPEDLNRLDALADNISNYALLADVTTAVIGMLTQVKIGNVLADVTTTPGTAVFNVNDVKTALSLDSYRLKSTKIPYSDITWGEHAPLTSINADEIDAIATEKGYLKDAVTEIRRDGGKINPISKGVINLGYTIKGIKAATGANVSALYPDASNNGIIDLSNWFHPKDPIFNITINNRSVPYTPSYDTFLLGNDFIEGKVLDNDGVDFSNHSIADGSDYESLEYEELMDYLITARTIDLVYRQIGTLRNSINRIDNTIPSVEISSTSVLAEPNKVYHSSNTNGLSFLNVALKAYSASTSTNPKACIYTLRFRTGESFKLNLKVVANNATSINANALSNVTILHPTNITWLNNTDYEVSILYDGYSYSLKQIPLAVAGSPNAQGFIEIG